MASLAERIDSQKHITSCHFTTNLFPRKFVLESSMDCIVDFFFYFRDNGGSFRCYDILINSWISVHILYFYNDFWIMSSFFLFVWIFDYSRGKKKTLRDRYLNLLLKHIEHANRSNIDLFEIYEAAVRNSSVRHVLAFRDLSKEFSEDILKWVLGLKVQLKFPIVFLCIDSIVIYFQKIIAGFM